MVISFFALIFSELVLGIDQSVPEDIDLVPHNDLKMCVVDPGTGDRYELDTDATLMEIYDLISVSFRFYLGRPLIVLSHSVLWSFFHI